MVLSMNISCSAQTSETETATQVKASDKVAVYYFHYSRRCATCQAVGSVSEESIAELYGNEVSFAEYNLDEEAGKTAGKLLDISGQTLLIVSGDTRINITNEGFMNAKSNPDKLKQIIKEKIDSLM